MAKRYISNNEYGAANLVALVLEYREIHGEIDDRLVALAGAIDEKIALLKTELLGGAGAAFDTFKELQDLFLENKDLIEELKAIAGKHVRFDVAQSLTDSEKTLVRSNIGAVSQADIDAAVSSATSSPTASVTKEGSTATITITDRYGTTTASVSDGAAGPVYQPSVDNDGNISWSNNGGLPNPATKNIRGPKGETGDMFNFDDLTEEQKEALRGRQGEAGPVGPQGYTFTPSVSSTGVITWTNNGGLTNPSAVNIKGPEGQQGPQGKPFTYDDFTQSQLDALRGPEGQPGQPGQDGKQGVTFKPSVSSTGVLTWTNDGGLANPSAVSLMGPKGDQGATGPAGTTTFSGLTDVPSRVKNAISSINGATADSNGAITISSVASATKATQDGSGNVITSTYATIATVNAVSATASNAASAASSAQSAANSAQTAANNALPKSAITYGTADLTANSSALATGTVYLVYE